MMFTLGYVKTDCRDLFLIRQKLQLSLEAFATSEYKLGIPVTYELEYSFLVAIFDNGKDHRRLNISFKDGFIILSLVKWGNAEQIIEACLKEMKVLGETFIHRNDCIGEPEKYE